MPLYEYVFNQAKKRDQASIKHHNRGARGTINTAIEKIITARLTLELGEKHKNEGRSCIDNTILRALDFLYSTSHEGLPPIRRLVVISDFLEQCEHSELMNGGFWFWSNNGSRMIDPDTAALRLADWEVDARPYEDLAVALVSLDSEKYQFPFKSAALKNYWEAFFLHQGVVADSIYPDLGIPAHFKVP